MTDSFSTTVLDWQGIDEKPTVGSHNLVESGGVIENIREITHVLETFRSTDDESKPYTVLAGNTINYSIKNNSTGQIKFHSLVSCLI